MATWKEEVDANQAKAEADRKADKERMEADRRDLKEMIKMMHANQTKTDAKLEGLSERIEKTLMVVLQTAEMCHDATMKRLKEDLTKTYNETCERIEETKCEFQARLDRTRQTRAERANTLGVSTCSAQPLTFNGNTTWSVFRRQFEVMAEHNQWLDQDKSTYLITALKG
jgi:3-oxoacyl-ACP reductase-like protein